MSPNADFLGPTCAFISSVTWAVGSSTYAKLSRDHTPFAVNFTRALVALPLFLVAALFVGGGTQAFAEVRPHHFAWFALSMFSSYGLGDVLFMLSTRSLGVPGALAIASSYPIWTAVVGALFYHQVLLPVQISGLILTVTGVVLVILFAPDIPAEKSKPDSAAAGGFSDRLVKSEKIGVLLAFATSFFWAMNSFSVARGGADLNPYTANVIRMMYALVMSALFGSLWAPGTPKMLTPRALRAAGGIIVFEAFGGSLAYTYGLSHSSLVLGSTLSSLAPVLAVPVAWALRLEKVSFLRTLGVGLVVTGLWLLVIHSG